MREGGSPPQTNDVAGVSSTHASRVDTSIADAAALPGYTNVSLCGVGATSRVFRAEEIETGRVVALKRLHRQMVRDPKALARLKREFEALRTLRHPALVPVSDVITWDGDPTLVMAFIEGEDLKERIVRQGRLSASETEHVARELFGLLSLTHGSGIVHRDIKPQNVRVTESGRIYLLDFGSARLDASSQLTSTGTSVGTPDYMAPELFSGSVYDPRVDVYGVGATLYECLTGAPPQVADSLAELAHLRSTVDIAAVESRAPGTPLALARVVDRCLARAPEDRFPSAALASWCLDHVSAERAFAARRSRNPVCLTCGSAITEGGNECPACHDPTPFRYRHGPAHVTIDSVENAARFFEYVAVRFPERATPEHVLALGESVSALSDGPQRYVSFVTERGATRIVRELGEVGVRARVEREPSLGRNMITTVLLTPAYLLWRAASGSARARASVLAQPALGRPVAPWITALALVSPLLFVLTQTPLMMMNPAHWATMSAPGSALFDGFWRGLTVGAAIAGPLLFAATLLLGRANPKIADHARFASAARGWREMFFAASARDERTPQRADAAPPWVALIAVACVAFQVSAQAFMNESGGPSESHTIDGQMPRTGATGAPVFTPGEASWDPVGALGPLNEPPMTWGQAWEVTRHQRELWTGTPSWDDSLEEMAFGKPTTARNSGGRYWRKWEALDDIAEECGNAVSFALGALGLAVVVKRRKRMKRDAAGMFAQLDLATFETLGTRTVPHRFQQRVGSPLDGVRTGDAFVAAAVKRASDVLPLLPPEEGAVLMRSLQALLERAAKQADGDDVADEAVNPVRVEDSMMDRCIVEADPVQKLRFDLLAIEGRAEALAADAWMQEIEAAAIPATARRGVR